METRFPAKRPLRAFVGCKKRNNGNNSKNTVTIPRVRRHEVGESTSISREVTTLRSRRHEVGEPTNSSGEVTILRVRRRELGGSTKSFRKVQILRGTPLVGVVLYCTEIPFQNLHIPRVRRRHKGWSTNSSREVHMHRDLPLTAVALYFIMETPSQRLHNRRGPPLLQISLQSRNLILSSFPRSQRLRLSILTRNRMKVFIWMWKQLLQISTISRTVKTTQDRLTNVPD